MSLREGIKAIVNASGTVCFPYKEKIREWFSEEKLSVIEPDRRHANRRYVNFGSISIDTEDIDVAIDKYCSYIFRRKNIGLAYDGIRRHRLTDVEFDDLSSRKMNVLIKKYFEEHYANDYPDFPIQIT